MLSRIFAVASLVTTVVAVPTPAAAPAPAANSSATFSNFFLIILENTDYSSAKADPNLAAFAAKGVEFTNWMAVTHPSQPNYIALTSGDTNGYTSDSTMSTSAKNIVDLLESETYSAPNQVYTAIAGRKVTNAGSQDNTALTHYSVLSTLERNFNLGNLGKSDATAPVFSL